MRHWEWPLIYSNHALPRSVVYPEEGFSVWDHVGCEERVWRGLTICHKCMSGEVWVVDDAEGLDCHNGMFLAFYYGQILISGKLVTTLLALPFAKARIPPAPSTSPKRLDLSFLKLLTFWMPQTGNVIQSFGYFLPTTYLPSYSTSAIGLSHTKGTLLVSLFNATSVIGGIVFGSLCDRFAVSNIMLLSSVGSALSVFLFWGLSSSPPSSTYPQAAIALMALFSITYGFFAGGYSSTWSGVLVQVKRDSPSLETGLVFGLLAGGRGIGNVISGPLSTALIDKGAIGGGEGMGYTTKYGTLIMFTGITALFGAWSWMWRYLRSAVNLVC